MTDPQKTDLEGAEPADENPGQKPAHDDHAAHSHAGHDHADHASHRHATHSHTGRHDHAVHSHAGHDHAHEHAGHDHSQHSHRVERPAQKRACGRSQAIQLDLAFALPGETDEIGRFEKLAAMLVAGRGVTHAHLRKDAGHNELCVHYDSAHTPADEVIELSRITGAKASKRFLEKTWFVREMDSAQCAQGIEHSLTRLSGVLSANVAYAAERLVVEYDRELVTPKQVEGRVEALGYALEEPQSGHACAHHAGNSGLAPKLELPLAAAAGVLVVTGFVTEHFALISPTLISVIYALAIAAGGFFAAKGTFQSLRQLRVDIESLMVLAALSAAILGAWFEGAFLLFLFSVGHAIEHRAMDRARRSVESLGALRPTLARVRRGDQLIEVPVSQVVRGDIVVVRPGDRLPLDGVIRFGQSSLDQSAITGESIAEAKGPGDQVFCGSINGGAVLEVEVTKLASESVLARVVDLVVQAEARKSPAQRLATKIEERFVPVVLVVALLLPVGLVLLGMPLKEALLRAVALLVAASPCALAISTPAAVLSAVAAAARGGVLVKGGAYLESRGTVTAIAFDKTGTLTLGQPKLITINALGGSDETLLATAASVESLSSHPISHAIVDGAKSRSIAFSTSATSLEAIHGRGLRAVLDGDAITIGNAALFDALPADVATAVHTLENAGQTTVIVKRAERFLGVLGVADTLRPNAKRTVDALKSLGITETIMLSGDNQRVAKAIGEQVGMADVRAPLMPEGKVTAIKALARSGKGVAMVGDGVNDAPALAAASVGIAMGGAASDVALETADIVLMRNDLNRLPFAVGLARQTTRIVRQNLTIAIGIAAVLIVCSVAGLAKVSQAVVFHEGGTLLVIANGLRLLRYRGAPD